MSVYNGEQYIREAMESILDQTFSDFEFLIIDDASTDRTFEIIQSFHDSRIRVIKNIENLGLTKSLNVGLRQAKGEYIARMDADDISVPERFEKQVDFLENHPDIALVGTARQVIDQRGVIIGNYFPPLQPQYRDFLKINPITHGSVIVRKKILEAYSGYNELFKNGQDYALWLQMAKQQKLYNIQDTLYKLRIHKKSVSKIGEESILYHILAIRIAESSIQTTMIEEIQKSGIRCLFKYFTRSEWVYYHYSTAGHYRFYGDLKGARQEYWKVFYLEPWNIQNVVNLIRAYLGKRLIDATGRVCSFLKK